MSRRTVLTLAVLVPLSLVLVLAAQRAATTRIPQFENDAVKVWKTTISPRQPLTQHRHENGRVLVALRGGKVRIVPQSGEPRTVTWESGKAYWLAADPPGQLHSDENIGEGDIEVVVVELKR
jgi:hypothetical protein